MQSGRFDLFRQSSLCAQCKSGTALCSSGAYGATAFFAAGSGVDCRFPDMSLAALPPDSLSAPRRYHFRRQTTVPYIVPLGGNLRIAHGKIIEACQNTPAGTIGAAGVFRSSRGNDSLPFVAKCASPPDLLIAEGCYLIWLQPAVSLRVPLCRELRKACRQIIFTGRHGFSRANRASRASGSAQDSCPP